jgi:hypothetical protein
MKFNLFCGGIKNTKPTKEITIEQFCEILKDENLKKSIDKIYACNDKKERQELKSKLDYVTFAGTFEERGDSNLLNYSGFICLDFDNLDNAALIKEVVMQKDKYVHLVFISPSGKGLKVIIKHPKSIKSKEEYNLIVKNAYIYFENQYKLKGDKNTYDLSRACYVSYDAKYIFKDKSTIFDKIDLIEKSKKEISNKTPETKKRKDIFFTQLLENQLTYIDDLKKTDEKNSIFLKNLAAWVCWDKENIEIAKEFVEKLGKEKPAKLLSWVEKSKKDKLKVNYYELAVWSKQYEANKLSELLSKQLEKSFKAYNEEEYIKALEIVENNPLKYCLEILTKRHIGEEHILLLLLASGISVGFDNRKFLLHIMGVGSSGKGKTDSMETVGKIFTNMYTITSASPKSIFYQSKDNKLPNKGILFYPENDNKEDFEALERVLTDDKEDIPSHNTVINGESVELAITQKNVFWRNSVKTSNDEDNQTNNRYYIYNVDESEQQDEKIYDLILNTWNYTETTSKEDLNIAKAITDILIQEKKIIYIPFVENIHLSRKDDRRIIKKFLKLLNAVVFFNRFQRINVGDFVIAYIDDFIIANYIWDKISRYESSKLSESESSIVETIASKNGICPTELSKFMKKDVSNLSKKLKDMEEKGIVYSENESITIIDETGNRKTVSKKKYYSSVGGTFGISFGSGLVNYFLTPESLETYFKAQNIEVLGNCKLGFGSFGTESETPYEKMVEKIVGDFGVSLSLKIIPLDIYKYYNNIYNSSIAPLSENRALVDEVPNDYQTTTKRLPKQKGSSLKHNGGILN